MIALDNYWVPDLGPLRSMLHNTTNPNNSPVAWVKDLIDHDPSGVRWNLPLLRSLWEEHVVQASLIVFGRDGYKVLGERTSGHMPHQDTI